MSNINVKFSKLSKTDTKIPHLFEVQYPEGTNQATNRIPASSLLREYSTVLHMYILCVHGLTD